MWLCLGFPVGAALAAETATPSGAERKGILDALRAKGEDRTRVFVVRFLKVHDGWAWVAADPQSGDGKNRYEAESALLKGTGDHWAVLDQPCSEEGCDDRMELARIKAAFPTAPDDIFPP